MVARRWAGCRSAAGDSAAAGGGGSPLSGLGRAGQSAGLVGEQVQPHDLRRAGGLPPPGSIVGTPLGALTVNSSPREVAAAIIHEAQRRGYSPQQTVAIVSTAMQESNLSPRAVSPNKEWESIFQQDDPTRAGVTRILAGAARCGRGLTGSGPRPITLRPLLTVKEGEGLRISATARWPSAPPGAGAGVNPEEKGGSATPRGKEWPGPVEVAFSSSSICPISSRLLRAGSICTSSARASRAARRAR